MKIKLDTEIIEAGKCESSSNLQNSSHPLSQDFDCSIQLKIIATSARYKRLFQQIRKSPKKDRDSISPAKLINLKDVQSKENDDDGDEIMNSPRMKEIDQLFESLLISGQQKIEIEEKKQMEKKELESISSEILVLRQNIQKKHDEMSRIMLDYKEKDLPNSIQKIVSWLNDRKSLWTGSIHSHNLDKLKSTLTEMKEAENRLDSTSEELRKHISQKKSVEIVPEKSQEKIETESSKPSPVVLSTDIYNTKELHSQVCSQYEEIQRNIYAFDNDSEKRYDRSLIVSIINTCVNSLTKFEDVFAKFKILIQFLQGMPVNSTIAGSYTLKQDSAFLLYAKSILVNKILAQLHTPGSNNLRKMFVLAFLTKSLCKYFPDLHKILTSILFSKCPLLIPHVDYKVIGTSQSLDQLMVALGYLNDGGSIKESTSEFLERTSRIAQFYSMCLMICNVLCNTSPNFRLISYFNGNSENSEDTSLSPIKLWNYFSSILNHPLPSGDCLVAILSKSWEVCSMAMNQFYGNQFKKMVQFAKNILLSDFQKTVTDDGKMYLEILKQFITSIESSNNPPPIPFKDTETITMYRNLVDVS